MVLPSISQPTEIECSVFVEAQSRRSGCALVHLRLFSIPSCSDVSLAHLSHACIDRRIDIISRLKSRVPAPSLSIHAVASLNKLLMCKCLRFWNRWSLSKYAKKLRSKKKGRELRHLRERLFSQQKKARMRERTPPRRGRKTAAQ